MVDMHGREPALVFMRVPEGELLTAVRGAECVVNVEDLPLLRLHGAAELIDQTTIEEVLRAKYRKAERNRGQKWMNPKRKKGVKSVRTTSGGTPGSGKRK